MLNLSKSWLNILESEFEKDYFKNIENFLRKEKLAWKIIYPKNENIFQALNLLDFEDVKVVILWQDPYHWYGQAHWLSFSVPDWVKTPPSLKNIYKEIESDCPHLTSPKGRWINERSWNLTNWEENWVLLLNSVLTVEKSKPASHSKIWWQNFTDEIIKKISEKRENIVFILWWAFAQSKESLISSDKHLILKSPHPSPFSVHKWFFGCKHFSKANNYLKSNWIKEINW